jgi:alpha-glucosidase
MPWKAPLFRAFVNSFQSAMRPGYTPIYTVGNHDESRIASRIGPAAARTAALMLLTLPGMAFVYYGEELGMTDVSIPDDQLRDPFLGQHGRDPERTPMQWDTSPNAGFSIAKPWLPVAADYAQKNVATEAQDPTSSLNLYKHLIDLRSKSSVLKYGDYESMTSMALPESVFGYKRTHGDSELLVLLNFTAQPQQINIKKLHGRVLMSTYMDNQNEDIVEHVNLRANEGILVAVKTKKTEEKDD